jgi:diguanylate cyclase (GGDEF)-like protein
VVRQYDFCARYAGDEFAILLAECTREEAERRALELQDAVSRARLEVEPGIVAALQISVGVALYPTDGLSFESLLAAADREMYADKADRRALDPAAAAVHHVSRTVLVPVASAGAEDLKAVRPAS